LPLAEFSSLLKDLADHFGETAEWKAGTFVVRFRIDPFTVPLQPTDAGLYATQTWAYTEIAQIPRDPDGRLPDVQDLVSIRDWFWEIVEVGDDDLGERQFRLLRREPVPPGGTVLWDRGMYPATPGSHAWDDTRWDIEGEGTPTETETEWEITAADRLPPGHEPPPPPFETGQTRRRTPLVDVSETAAPIIPTRAPGRPTRRLEIEAAYLVVGPRFPPATPLTQLYGPIRREITGRDFATRGLSDKTLARIVGPLHRRRRR
jgi:hypothetical protein